MKRKAIKKIIIVLIIIILIVAGGCAYLYATTDLFKSNEQLFFKYAEQILDKENGFIDSRLTAYVGKQQTSKYQKTGTFSVDIDTDLLNTEILQTVNEFYIEYDGIIDNVEEKYEGDITLHYAEDVEFPFKYKYANETLGLQTDYVSSKYIGIENSNLQEFIEKFGITNVENIPDTVDISSEIDLMDILDLTEEEIEQLKNTYISILREKVLEKEFGKTQEGDTVSYFVEVSYQELKELVITFLETVKDDQIIMSKFENMFEIYFQIVNNTTTEEITLSSMIQEYIDAFTSSEFLEGSATITISQTNGNVTGMALTIDNNEFKIEKSSDQETLNYAVTLNLTDTDTGDTVKCEVILTYEGLDTLETVNSKYQIIMDDEEQTFTYNINFTDIFDDSISIDNFEEDEIQIINDYDSEDIITLLITIINRINDVNTMQMEEIGFSEYGNPLGYISIYQIFYMQAAQVNIEDVIENSETQDDAEDVTEDNSEDSITSTLSQTEIQQFNQQFTSYEGTSVSAANVRALLQTILANNMVQAEDDRKVSVSGNVTMSIEDTQAPTSDIQTGSTYTVEIRYTDDGIVGEIVITEN